MNGKEIDTVKRGKAFENEAKREIRDLPTGGLMTDYDVFNFQYRRRFFALHWDIL